MTQAMVILQHSRNTLLRYGRQHLQFQLQSTCTRTAMSKYPTTAISSGSRGGVGDGIFHLGSGTGRASQCQKRLRGTFMPEAKHTPTNTSPMGKPKLNVNMNMNRNVTTSHGAGRGNGSRYSHRRIIQSQGQAQFQKRFKATVTSGAKNATTVTAASARTSTRTGTKFPSIAQLKSSLNEMLLRPRTLPIPRWVTPRPFSFTISECFGHASFVLVAVSYALDDFLYLRIIAVAGSTSMLFFTYFHPHGRVLWLPFKWNALFILINSYRIARTLYYQNMGNRLDENMKRIKHDYFDLMDLVDFAKLTSIAREEVFDPGELMLHQGQKHHYIRMVLEGEMDVFRDGIKTYALYEGNFISEAGLHAGLLLKGSVESCCTIVASNSCKRVRCLVWNRTELIELLNREGGLKRSLKAALSWDIVRKLKGQRQSLTDHKVKDPTLWTLKRKEQSEDRYAAILQNIVQHEDDDFSRRRIELDHYRKIHHIDDNTHRRALEKCGWTVGEYDTGKKKAIVTDP